MTAPTWTIYTAPADLVTPELLRSFLDQQRQDRLFMESPTLELKRERRGDNVLKAIAGLANAAGGIVLLGVDENEPSLDESPGVPPGAVVAVLNECQSGLNPVVEPEIIPIAIPEADQIVLVIRVESDPGLWPVVLRGRVYVRQMGQTVPATHEQIVDLVRRRTGGLSSVPMTSVGSVFTPGGRGAREPHTVGDLAVRCASAVYTRNGTSNQLLLGASERAELGTALGSSSLAGLAQDALPRGSSERREVLELLDDERTSRMYRAHCDIVTDGLTDRLAIEVRVSGPQVAFAIDFHARLGSATPEQPRPPRFQRHELLLALLCALDTARQAIVPVIASWMGGAPARVDDFSCWVESPRAASLAEAMDLRDVSRLRLPHEETPWAPSQWTLQVAATDNPDTAAEVVRNQLRSHYLDLAIDDETTVLDRDMRQTLTVRSRLN